VLESGHQQVANTLEELEVFAGVLGRNLGVGATNEGDGVSADFLDVRLQDRVRGDFQERHVLGAEFLNDLVESSTEEHGLTNVVPAVLNIQVALEPLSVDGGHDFRSRLAGGGESTLDEVLEEGFLSLHERGVESAGNAKFGSENLVGGVSGNLNHEVDEFVLTGNGDSLGRVDTSNPEATVDSARAKTFLIMSFAFWTPTPRATIPPLPSA
jgi:hypothetical protein